MTRKIGKEFYPGCKEQAEGDPRCFKPHTGAAANSKGEVKTVCGTKASTPSCQGKSSLQ